MKMRILFIRAYSGVISEQISNRRWGALVAMAILMLATLAPQQAYCQETTAGAQNQDHDPDVGFCDASCELERLKEEGWKNYVQEASKNISILQRNATMNYRESAAILAEVIRNRTATEQILNGLKAEIEALERDKTRLGEDNVALENRATNLEAQIKEKKATLASIIKNEEELKKKEASLKQSVTKLEADVRVLNVQIEAKQDELATTNPFRDIVLTKPKIDEAVHQHVAEVSTLQRLMHDAMGSVDFLFYFMCAGWALCLLEALAILRLYPYYRSAKFLTNSVSKK